jgi:Tol biopolymer transport system component
MFLPDGEHFVFLCDSSNDDGHRLYVHSLDGSEKKILQKAIRSAIFVDFDGALLWSQNGQLFGRPFDFDRREFTGPQVLVQDDLNPFSQRHECALTLSRNGLMAFQKGSDEAIVVRVAIDGSSRELIFPADRYRNPRLSPDGQKIAFEVAGTTFEHLIWVQDLERGSRTLISERGVRSDSPTWSADGEMIYFGSSTSGTWEAYRKRVYGGTAPELLGAPENSSDVAVLDCSADGRWLLVAADPSAGMDIFLLPLDSEEATWIPWSTTAANEHFARFSPDATWIAFESNVSGKIEVYVAPREGGPEVQQWMVSVNGGTDPVWSRDASKLYYRDQASTLMEVDVRVVDGRVEFETPERVFELQPPNVGYLRNVYDLAPDGESLVAFVEAGGHTPAIRVRSGWRGW